MMQMSELLEIIGRDTITSRCGFRKQDFSRAAKQQLFPSGWYPYIQIICAEKGVDTPYHLFRWSKVPTKDNLEMVVCPVLGFPDPSVATDKGDAA